MGKILVIAFILIIIYAGNLLLVYVRKARNKLKKLALRGRQ